MTDNVSNFPALPAAKERQHYCRMLAQTLTLITLMLIPFSDSLSRSCMMAAALFALLSGHWTHNIKILMQWKSVTIALLLILFFAIGASYSPAPLLKTTHGFFKYTKLLYFIVLIPLFAHARMRRQALNVFFISMAAAATLYTFTFYTQLYIHGFQTPTGTWHVNPISISLLVANAAFFLMHRILNEKPYRHINTAIFAYFVFFLFFINRERTGMLAFTCLLPFLFFQKMGSKGLLLGIVVTASFLWVTLQLSPTFHQTIDVSVLHKTIKASPQDRPNAEKIRLQRASINARLTFFKDSWRMLKKSPLMGRGTGSFQSIYLKEHGAQIPNSHRPLGHPHNEFLMVAFQIGLVGLSVFMAWLLAQAYEIRSFPLPERHLAQGLLISFIINGLCHVSLYTNASGLSYLIFLATFFGAAFNKKQRETHDL